MCLTVLSCVQDLRRVHIATVDGVKVNGVSSTPLTFETVTMLFPRSVHTATVDGVNAVSQRRQRLQNRFLSDFYGVKRSVVEYQPMTRQDFQHDLSITHSNYNLLLLIEYKTISMHCICVLLLIN